MRKTISNNGKAGSVPGGLAVAACVSLAITAALSSAVAYFLDSGNITWGQAGYWIMGMLFAASFIGGKCAYLVIKRQRIVVSLMSGVLYWGLLLCFTALFFGGEFEGILETAGVIGAGSGTAALLFKSAGRKKQGRAYW